ncbi:MAG: hypothetical protein KF680_01710 [Cryobacterium sp.]|nr:hypothetical protein [Cryobacterium sp.]
MQYTPNTARSLRTGGKLAAITTIAALALTGCFGIPLVPQIGGDTTIRPQKSEAVVNYLYAAGPTGGTGEMRISVQPSDDGDMKVDISENEVSGLGDMMRGAAWNSVTIATILTGANLDNHYRFQIGGRVDGPSAGALSTAGVLSILLGDNLIADVTMTGTILPTGAVGPVGGIPQKIQGAIDSGKFTKILIPQGQRNSANNEGNSVDVVALGATGGIEVVEVSNIYEAYQHLTGAELPAPSSAPEPRNNEEMRTKLRNATATQLAGFDQAVNDFFSLDGSIQDHGWGLYLSAAEYGDDARRLESQGLQAGAFVKALNANLFMSAVTKTYQAVEQTLRLGIDALNQKLAAAETNTVVVNAYLDTLGSYSPKTITDAEALITAYGNTFDAFALSQYASNALRGLIQEANEGVYSSIEQIAEASIWPIILFEFAGGQVEAARAIFDVGRDNTSASIDATIDLQAIGSFFRRAADANWNAFMVTTIQPAAEANGLSNDAMLNRVMNIDVGVALAFSANQYIPGLQRYIGEGSPNSAYAAMGYGFLNYSRNAILMEKYGGNAHLDQDFNIVGVQNEIILSRALELAKTQMARSVSILEANGSSPVLAIASFEDANVNREGDVSDRFTALESYSGGFVATRMLSYIGGYPTQGYSR